MGSVYLAEDTRLGRRVALKFLDIPSDSRNRALARFRREARLLASLRHPNLVNLFDVDLDASPPCIVQEFLDGKELHGLVSSGGLFDECAVFSLALDMAKALSYLHEQGVMHRDIKPANVFRDTGGRFRLMDFGLALETEGTRFTADGCIVGTLLYMPPEILKGGPYAPAADVYQLGLLLYSVFTGDDLHALQEADAPLPAGARPLHGCFHRKPLGEGDLPGRLLALVDACCRIAPGERPVDGSALLCLVKRLLDGCRLGGPPFVRVRPRSDRRRSRRLPPRPRPWPFSWQRMAWSRYRFESQGNVSSVLHPSCRLRQYILCRRSNRIRRAGRSGPPVEGCWSILTAEQARLATLGPVSGLGRAGARRLCVHC